MQYISGRRINQDFGVPGITTNDTVINVDGRIAVGIGTTATASVDTDSLKLRGDLIDTDGLTGEIGYFLSKDAGGLVWSAVNPSNENSVFVSQDGNQVGVSSYIGFNFKSDGSELVAISTNTGNPAIADIEILSRWNRDANTGIYTSKNIGIGSTTPNVALDIVGDGNFTGIVTANKFASNSASVTNLNVSGVSTFLGISTFSKIGIGTTAPTEKLEIIGGAKVSGILTAGGLDVTGSFTVSSATTATNIGGGQTGRILYQDAPGTTGFLTTGDPGQVLTSQGAGQEPVWGVASGLGTNVEIETSGIITSTGGFVGDLVGIASTAINLSAGSTGSVPYQYNTGITSFLDAPSEDNKILGYSTTNNKIVWTNISDAGGVTTTGLSTASVGIASTAINLANGLANQIPYQTEPGTTEFLPTGTVNQVLTSQGPGQPPSWQSAGSASAIEGITIKYDGSIVGSAGSITNVNFAGNGVVATATAGGNIATVTINLPTGIVTAGGLSTASVGSATTATNLDDGSAGEIPYQHSAGITTFLSAPGPSNQVLLYDDGNNKPKWGSVGLGTNTTGDYVKSVASGNEQQISISGATGEGADVQISIANNPTLPGNLTVNQDLNVGGNIFIGGTTASLDVNEFKVTDKNIIAGFTTNTDGNEVSSDTTANGGGISIASTVGNPLVDLNIVGIDTLPTTYKRLHWYQENSFGGLRTDAWLSNYAIGIGSTQLPNGTRLAAGNVQITENDIIGVGNVTIGNNLNVTGISTLGVVEISSGIITNTNAGAAVTVFGDLIGTASTASFAATAGNLGAGSTGSVPYQYGSGLTTFLDAPSEERKILGYSTTNNKIVWTDIAGVGGVTTTGLSTASVGFASTARDVIGGIGSITSLTVSGISSSSAFADFDYLQARFDTTVAFAVTVAPKDTTHRYIGTGSTNAYLINGVQAPFLTLTPGRTYRFNNDNTGSHPLKFYLEADKTTEYTSGVSFQSTYTELTVGDETPTVLHYQCTAHGYMGNAVQTNSNVVNTNYPAILRDNLDVTGVSTFSTNIYIKESLYDNNDSKGTNGQLLISTGTGIQWNNLDGSGIGTAIAAGQNIFEQQIGTPYYITASDVTTGIATGGFINTTIVSKDGNIGINKASPSRYLEIGGTSNNPQIRLSNAAGTSSLEVLGNAASGQEIRFGTEASPQAGRLIYHNSDNSLSYSNTGGERLRVNSGGNIGIGSTQPTAKLDVVGDTFITGVVTATDFNSTSDARLKTNVQVIDEPLDKIVRIDGVSFNWIKNNKPSMGVIADNIQEVLPELVSGSDPKTVNYNGLIGLLIEVVKEQQTQIDSLNDRLSRLE